jgi:hypothetical protein
VAPSSRGGERGGPCRVREGEREGQPARQSARGKREGERLECSE